jgi:hypothetical protein
VLPQLRAYYLTGQLDSCQQVKDDFRYCYSVLSKASNEERRRELYVKHKAEQWAERRMGKSSEDVWTVRSSVASLPLSSDGTSSRFFGSCIKRRLEPSQLVN